MNDTPLDPHQRRQVAVESCSSVPTVERYLNGGNTRSTTRSRIETALQRLGLERLVQTASDSPSGAEG